MKVRPAVALTFGLVAVLVPVAQAQQQQQAPPPAPQQAQPPRRPPAPFDEARARELYVSKDPKDHSPGRNFAREIEEREGIEKRYAEASKGVMSFRKVSYRSSVGDL